MFVQCSALDSRYGPQLTSALTVHLILEKDKSPLIAVAATTAAATVSTCSQLVSASQGATWSQTALSRVHV